MKRKIVCLFVLVMAFAACSLTACGDISLSLTEDELQLTMYEEYDLSYRVKGASRDDVAWSSSEPKVASVQEGKITTLSVGTTVITGELGNKKVSCSVLVTRNRVGRSILVDKSELTLEVGDTQKINATFKENGVQMQADIVWESSRPDIVAVDDNGNVTALARGNAVVSAYTRYKGQRVLRDIPVRVTVTAHKDAPLVLQNTAQTDTVLTPLGEEKTQYGFTAEQTAYRYTSAGGFDSRLFVEGAYKNGNEPQYDRLVFFVKFASEPTEGTAVWLANYRKYVRGYKNMVTQDACFVYYDADGNIAKSFDADTLYTAVLHLQKAGNGITEGDQTRYEYGFALLGAGEAYIGGAVLCSEDYFTDTYGLQPPEELPALNYVYAETGTGLNVGASLMPQFDKYWEANSSGTAAEWDNSLWENRIAIGGITYSDYRKYEYMRMDVLFTDVSFRYIIFWTGGYAMRYYPDGHILSTETDTWTDEDIRVFDGDEDVTGQPLATGVVYTFRIRVQRQNLENVAFGMHVNSASADRIYLAAPTFTDY